ncbi:C-C chemokine receptor type 9-like [Molothrus ater]|uniref:C-C chemokine receptor type 9-like n=1 Tax=Molothrus ater TaxID=84834 RepID=UPI0017484DF9|nr:C-C chemokine receptor type 9-like [Molothrus ater]
MAGGSQETAASADGSAGKRPAQDGHPSSSLRTGTAAAALHPSEPGLLLPSPAGTPPPAAPPDAPRLGALLAVFRHCCAVSAARRRLRDPTSDAEYIQGFLPHRSFLDGKVLLTFVSPGQPITLTGSTGPGCSPSPVKALSSFLESPAVKLRDSRQCGVTHPGKSSLDYYRNDSMVLSLCENPVNNSTDFMCDKRQVRQFAQAFLPVFFWLIFAVGTVGNTLVVLVYCKYHFRRSMMDLYLLHLAIADLLLLFTFPFWAKAASDGWIFKDFMCKVVNSMYKINFYGCSLLLTCISFDRYITVVQAMKAKTCKRRWLLHSRLMCLAVWLTSVSLCIPELIYSQSTQVGDVTVCKIMYPPNVSVIFRVTVLALKVIIGFFLPLLVMVICYALIINTLLQAKRFQKQKSLKIITMILTAFLLSQFPYNIVLLVKAINTYTGVVHSCQVANQLDIGLQVTQIIAFLHSCLNPFLYVFAGERFRMALGRMMQSCGCCWSRAQEHTSACDSQEHSSNWSFAMLGGRRVRNSLILNTHWTSSVMSPPCKVIL